MRSPHFLLFLISTSEKTTLLNMIHVYHDILQVGDSSGWAMLSALLLSNPQLCEPDCWTPGRILMGEFYRCDSWGKVLSTCENQVSCLQSQPGHSKIIMQMLKNNEIGLENRMGLGILCFICLMVFLPFAAMYSNLPFFPLHSKENWRLTAKWKQRIFS